jgi:hypothetical protein
MNNNTQICFSLRICRKLDLILNWTAFKILYENIESRGFRNPKNWAKTKTRKVPTKSQKERELKN